MYIYIYIYIYLQLIFLSCRLANLNEEQGTIQASLPSFYVALARCQVWWQNCEMRFGIDFIPLRSPVEHIYRFSVVSVCCPFAFSFLLCKLLTSQTCVACNFYMFAFGKLRERNTTNDFYSNISFDAPFGSLLGFSGIMWREIIL